MPAVAYFCPECGAELPEALVASGLSQVGCPACNRWVALDTVAPAHGPATYHGMHRDEQDPFADDPPPSHRMEGWVEGRRLVIHIRAGSNRVVLALLGCVVCVAGTLGFMTYLGVAGKLDGGALDPLGYAVFAVLWGLVARLAGSLVCARFEATSVLVEPEHLVVEKRLFGFRRQKTYRLGLASRATFTPICRIWRNTIYAIRIGGHGKHARIGPWLLDREKRWLVQQINGHLHGDRSEPEIQPNETFTMSFMDGFEFGGD